VNPDATRLAEVARDAVRGVARVAEELGARTVEAASDDGAIVTEANLHGRLTGLRLRADAMRAQDSVSLAEAITGVIRAAQRRGREEYEAGVAAATPPEIAEYRRLFRRW
jgi:DNA-binding protein YbaB